MSLKLKLYPVHRSATLHAYTILPFGIVTAAGQQIIKTGGYIPGNLPVRYKVPGGILLNLSPYCTANRQAQKGQSTSTKEQELQAFGIIHGLLSMPFPLSIT